MKSNTNQSFNEKHIDAFGYAIHPKRFMLWLAIAAMMMMFAAFTSAFIVKRGDTQTWLRFDLPSIFNWSTIVVVLSSIFLQMAYTNYKKGKRKWYMTLLSLTFSLGAIFLLFQWMGWQDMKAMGLPVDGNPSGSFTYVISGAHAIHLIGGLVALLMTIIYSGLKSSNPVDNIIQKVNPKGKLYLELILTYWHFVGILWVYLFFFFKLNQ